MAGWSTDTEYTLRAERFEIVHRKNTTKKVRPSTRNNPGYLFNKNVNFPIAVVKLRVRLIINSIVRIQ